MRIRSSLLYSLTISIVACHPRAEAALGPGSPAPVAGPAAEADPQPGASASTGVGGSTRRQSLPGRAKEAPLVGVWEALETDSLLGRRVRVAGRCTAVGEGERAGSWTLENAGSAIEVRGLVPSSCAARPGEELTIFAQIEPKASDSRDRLLLRLPD